MDRAKSQPRKLVVARVDAVRGAQSRKREGRPRVSGGERGTRLCASPEVAETGTNAATRLRVKAERCIWKLKSIRAIFVN